MKSAITIFGVILVIFGISALAYQGFTYTQHETVAQIGDMKITAETQKTVYLSPLVGGLSLAAGLVLIALGRKNQS